MVSSPKALSGSTGCAQDRGGTGSSKKPRRECSRRGRFGNRPREYRPMRLPRWNELLRGTRVSRIFGERRPAPCAPTSRDPCYQGSPFRSGACTDCSGNPPAISIIDMTSTPANPPPITAAKTHQNETIGSPLLALIGCPPNAILDCAPLDLLSVGWHT